jgi:hypothetical protein
MILNGLSDLDHVALSRAHLEMLWRIDHGLGDAVYQMFTEDGEIWSEQKLFCKGHAAIKKWGDNRLDPETIRHTAVNYRFEADGPDAAKGTGVQIVYHAPEQRYGPEATVPLLVGEWTCRAVRTSEGWRFTSIDFHRMFDRREQPGGFF